MKNGCFKVFVGTIDLNIRTTLSLDEARERLNASIDHEKPDELTITTAVKGTHEVIGWLKDNQLHIRRRILYSSLFQPALSARLIQEAAGTVIDGTIAMQKGARTFYLVWFIALSALVAVIFFATLMNFIQGTAIPGTWTGFLVPIVPLIFWAGYRRYSRRVIKRESEFITQFIRRTLSISDPQ